MDSDKIRGWCPSGLRPMASGDGLIVRLKIVGGTLGLGLAAAIARWSIAWGNGQIDLSRCGNLQMRGVTAATLPHLQEALAQNGLLDDTPTIIASPLAGIDRRASFDSRHIAATLSRRLADEGALRDLPAKFNFLIDDGGQLGLGDTKADIRFEACANGFTAYLDGFEQEYFGPYHPAELPDIAASLALAFLALRRGHEADIRRMSHLRPFHGIATIADESGLIYQLSERPALGPTPASHYLGVQPLDKTAFLGVGLPFGRIVATELIELTAMIADHGGSAIRLTPWRAVLVPLASVEMARDLADRLTGTPMILAADEPRRLIAACPGAPSCIQASTTVRDDATLLAALFARSSETEIQLHVSGCGKGCAHPRPAPVTLVGNKGRYDVIGAGGSPSDLPVLQGLSVAQATDYLRDFFR